MSGGFEIAKSVVTGHAAGMVQNRSLSIGFVAMPHSYEVIP